MKYRILIESKYASLPFNGFIPLHRGININVWESLKHYYKADGLHYIEQIVNKHPEAIYAIKLEDMNNEW